MTNISYLEHVTRTQPFGWEYIPADSAPYYFTFEQIDHFYWHELASSNWKCAFYAGVVYISVIFGLQHWMKDRPAFSLKGPLFWWNLTLGIFSILGFSRSLPGFLHVLGNKGGFYTSICEKKGADVPFGFWAILFTLSKFVELGDTVFIVLRKRPLIFLQWYHHLVTMICCWIMAPLAEPVARWCTVLNFGVHSLMYPYFALKVVGIRIPPWVANLITTLQLAQMVTGLGLNMMSIYYKLSGHACVRYPSSIQISGLVYGSFFILFGKLFYDSVIKQGRIRKQKLAKKLD